jgi:hypothetical protein
MTGIDTTSWWDVSLDNMPDFRMSMQRIYAWFEGAVIDRAPIRFQAHNAFVEEANLAYHSNDLKRRWFDTEFQIDSYLKSIDQHTFHGETFPIFWPNLGPEVYSAFYGSELGYGEITSWSKPLLMDWADISKVKLDMHNEYFTKIEEVTLQAIERCRGKALVGFTDLHAGVDCAAAWRKPEQFCIDLLEEPEQAKALIELAIADFEMIYDHFDATLKAHGQLSASWMGIPSFGRMHIPSCDFAALISPKHFDEFCLPVLQREVKTMTHNVFHVDGKGVARHLNRILEVPEVHAIQWVQGVGADYPIMQWVPFIKQIQARRPVIVDLKKTEVEAFISEVRPEGIFLWVATENEDEELALLKLVEKWV